MEVKSGARAPFAGILLTPAALAKVITALEAETERVRAELAAEKEAGKARLKAAREKASAELTAEREKREAVEAARERDKEIFDKAVTKALEKCKIPWYKSPYLWAVVGGGICAGSVAAAR